MSGPITSPPPSWPSRPAGLDARHDGTVDGLRRTHGRRGHRPGGLPGRRRGRADRPQDERVHRIAGPGPFIPVRHRAPGPSGRGQPRVAARTTASAGSSCIRYSRTCRWPTREWSRWPPRLRTPGSSSSPTWGGRPRGGERPRFAASLRASARRGSRPAAHRVPLRRLPSAGRGRGSVRRVAGDSGDVLAAAAGGLDREAESVRSSPGTVPTGSCSGPTGL